MFELDLTSYLLHLLKNSFFKVNLKEKENNHDQLIIEKTKEAIKFTFEKIFETLDSEWKQKEFFREHCNYVEPKECSVIVKNNKFQENSLNKQNKERTKKLVIGHYVPMKPKLEILLSLPENREKDVYKDQLLKSKKIYSEITDGKYVKTLIENKMRENEKKKSTNEKEILMFVFYYDDIEVVNAIGASRKKHKIGNFI